MLPPANHLQSSDVSSYTYISLFMLTYPKSDTIHLNGDIREHLSSLNNFLDRPTPHRKTLLKLRHDLVRAFQQRFFPDKESSQQDSFDLLSLFSSFPVLFGLSFPVPFLEDLSKAQEAISVSLLTTDSSIKSFFSSLQSHQQSFLTSDISFLFSKLLEYIEQHHLPSWHNVFNSIKQALVSDLFGYSYSFTDFLGQPTTTPETQLQSSSPALPDQLVQLLASHESFVLITEPFRVTEFGSDATRLNPLFETHLRGMFRNDKGEVVYPKKKFRELLIDTMSLLIQDQSFRQLALTKVNDMKKLSASDSDSASKVSA